MPSTPDPFISRADLGNKLGTDLSSDDHALAAVDAACDMCRTISEQSFNRGTSTITLDGSGTEEILLPEYPVNTVGTVYEDGGTLTSGDWVLDPATGSLIRVPTAGYISSNFTTRPSVVWNRGRRNVTLDYDHGWDISDIPRDVRMVALNIATRFYEQTSSATFEQLGQRQVRYDGQASDLSDNELRILRKYKREKQR